MARTGVQGLGKLKAALAKATRGVKNGADEALREVSEDVADDWRAGVPVDTGAYRDSIEVTEDGVEATAGHAPFVEFGTSTTPAVPAAAAAAERARGSFPKKVAGAVRGELP